MQKEKKKLVARKYPTPPPNIKWSILQYDEIAEETVLHLSAV